VALIADVRAFAVGAPEPHDSGNVRCVTLVRIEDADGAVGWGEAVSLHRHPTLATKVFIDEGFGPLLVDRDPRDVVALWHELRRHSYRYGPQGITGFAISAIDMALWDLKGQQVGQPVAVLLGGRLTSEIPAMASIHFDMRDLDWTLNEFEGFCKEGYGIVKAGWGMTPDAVFGMDRELDVHYVREIRQVVGDDRELVVDLPGARGLWDAPTAIRRFRDLEEFRLRWIEQPLPTTDVAGHAKLRQAVTTPIGTGEDEWSVADYRRLIDAEAVDVLQFDPGRCLGITGSRQVVDAAEQAQLVCSAHSWSSALNTAASLHVLASSPAGYTLDFKPHESPLQHELVDDPWVHEDGNLRLRDRPGLGVTVRQDVVDRYALS
jgi:L-alanine-DL-glutamate epimerase-like enolase superfamily enzyme